MKKRQYEETSVLRNVSMKKRQYEETSVLRMLFSSWSCVAACLVAFFGLRVCRGGTSRGMFTGDVVVHRESLGTTAIWRLQDPFRGVFHDSMVQLL